jgi:chloramphenicol-sensitive protein RarD
MSPSAATPGGGSRQALAAGIGCYVLWSAMPVLFMVMGRAGASPWEILAQRVIWSLPCAAVLVLAAGQTRQVLEAVRRPRVLGALALTALLITANWAVYVWAVTNGRNLEASLGYYINPLMAMAAGAVIFRERIHALGWTAIGLASVGVVLQAVALGHPPYISLALATAFCGYGVLRKQVDAEAQTGLFIECALLVGPGAALQWWLARNGHVIAGGTLGATLLLAIAGPMTVVPLALFSWAARRLPFSIIGFLQFIVPSAGFAVGLATGEALTPMRALSFAFIWVGAGVFLAGVWRASRAMPKPVVQSAA